jgi:hypothetical protein
MNAKNVSFTMLFTTLIFGKSFGQFSITGQLRTRSELRDGQGAPLPKEAKSAFFTSQRTRLSFGYNAYRLKMGVTLQDVRVWGQDVSTINRTSTADNNGFLLHEAWAEIGLTDSTIKSGNVSLKIGRQELVYDDQRLLGNLDWLQQGRRHDAAVLKFENKSWMIHSGYAFNQNKENATGTSYSSTPPGNYTGNTNGGSAYKSLEYLYTGYKLKSGTASFLFLADQFSKYHLNTTTKVYDTGVWNRMTTGIYFNNTFNKVGITGSAYYQFGKTSNGQKLDAALLSLATQFAVSKKFSVGPGVDYTTGGSSADKSYAFDPLYGTPHKFWGLMDYFYASSGFGNKGLQDYYIKSKYKATPALLVTADAHRFYSASNIYTGTTKLSRLFGTELDFTANYSLTKMIAFEAGYSHFFSTSSLASPTVKNVTDAQKNNNWAYVMINIKPEFFIK